MQRLLEATPLNMRHSGTGAKLTLDAIESAATRLQSIVLSDTCLVLTDRVSDRSSSRRFPAPWRADKITSGYVVRDFNERTPAYIYSRENEADARQFNGRRLIRQGGSPWFSQGLRKC